ncbi:TPA: transporter, partial [Listeria innocua]|nr:transporter [Listeria innocua]
TDGFDVSKLETIHDLIASVPDVKKVIDIKARMNGNRIWIDATIAVDPDLNVVKSHEITEIVEQKIRNEYEGAFTLVHIEPFFE